MLVIGAGPAGLFTAAELLRHGAAVRIVDRAERPHHEARATSIRPGTLEILASVGLAAPFLDAGLQLTSFRSYGPDLDELRATSYAGLDCRYQFLCSLPQYETERILTERLTSLGGRVERGVAATFDPDAGGDPVVELEGGNRGTEVVHPDVVVGAGGAHGPTRHAMAQTLTGITYPGEFVAAEIEVSAPFPRDQATFVFGTDGLVLLAPLPHGHWMSFVELRPDAPAITPEGIADRVEQRLGGRCRPTGIAWSSRFRMHRRIVGRLDDGRRFLIGDAAHLSSPFAGEGLNSGLQDGYDLAWKLALVARGRAAPALLDDYAVERMIADRHVMDVSDRAHRAITAVADAVRHGRPVPPAVSDPVADALRRDASAMIDIDYAGSPLVVDRADGAVAAAAPHPGQRYPDWTRMADTTRHHALVFGPVPDAGALAELGRRWDGLVRVVHDPDLDAARAGVPAGGTILVRPDGHIGFRSPAADAAALAALDRHLSTYLVAAAA